MNDRLLDVDCDRYENQVALISLGNLLVLAAELFS